MSQLKRVIVVDDEPAVLALLAKVLPPDEFEVQAFADARDALLHLHELRPDLIMADVMMPDMDGHAFFQAVKRSPRLKDTPFIFISAAHGDAVSTLDRGADDFVEKPFNIPRLVAKVRATLRLARRLATAPPAAALTGAVGEQGTLPLFKFCEDTRLSGRLSVESDGKARWVEFLGGELVLAGGPPDEAVDPIDALLAVHGGSYRIEQNPLDPDRLKAAESRARIEEPASAVEPQPPPIPAGRLSKVEVRGESVEIQTEGENRPNFSVTTVIARNGQVLRKIESAWERPLERREDEELARSQIDRQHQRVLAMVRELTAEGTSRRAVAALPEKEGTVDGALLAWAISFIAEQARGPLGSVATMTLLRRSHARIADERPVLRSFQIVDDTPVVRDLSGRPGAPAGAVDAVAGWTVAFLAEARTVAEKGLRIRVREATRMMEGELERVGFYAAFDQAAGEAPESSPAAPAASQETPAGNATPASNAASATATRQPPSE